MSPEVKAVNPNPDYTLTITFENGEVRIFDVKPYMNRSDFFGELKDLKLFNTVKPSFLGSVEWKNRQDLSADTLYLESKRAEISKAVQA